MKFYDQLLERFKNKILEEYSEFFLTRNIKDYEIIHCRSTYNPSTNGRDGVRLDFLSVPFTTFFLVRKDRDLSKGKR